MNPVPSDFTSVPSDTGDKMCKSRICGKDLVLLFSSSRIPALEAALVKIMDEGRSYVAVDQEAPEVTMFIT